MVIISPPAGVDAQHLQSTTPEIACMLDPTADGTVSGLLRELALHDDTGFTDQVAKRLRNIAHLLNEPKPCIVFGGHFSSGKSSLINALIGTPLLPTSDFPETGVPCVIRTDTTNHIQAITDGGKVGLAFDTDAITRVVSLITDSGEYSSAVQHVRWLVISLIGNAPPAGVTWIDSPGINDTSAMTERATEVADVADVLVWVVNSRQALSEIEQTFLHTHVATHGPASVVFIVNAFLRSDDLKTWTWFLEQRASYFRARISNSGVTNPMPPVVVTVSARAAATDPTGFGATEAHRLLRSVVSIRSPRVRATRCYRASHRLRRVTEAIQLKVDDERNRRVLIWGARAEQQRRVDLIRQHFCQQLGQSLGPIFAQRRSVIERCTSQVLETIATQPLRYDNSYGDAFTQGLAEIGKQLAADIIAEVNRCAAACGLGRLTPSAVANLNAMLVPRAIVIEVPRTSHTKGKAGVGAVIGGIVGTMVIPVPGLGSAIGAAVGAAAGAASGAAGNQWQTATEQDRASAAANTRTAAELMTVGLMAQQTAVYQLITAPDATPVVLVEPPSEARLRALTAMHNYLTESALPLLDSAANDALREITT